MRSRPVRLVCRDAGGIGSAAIRYENKSRGAGARAGLLSRGVGYVSGRTVEAVVVK